MTKTFSRQKGKEAITHMAHKYHHFITWHRCYIRKSDVCIKAVCGGCGNTVHLWRKRRGKMYYTDVNHLDIDCSDPLAGAVVASLIKNKGGKNDSGKDRSYVAR